MGRTLLGIDLDESPFGGLIERLLDEEDLAKLDARPDGGTAPDGAADSDDGIESGSDGNVNGGDAGDATSDRTAGGGDGAGPLSDADPAVRGGHGAGDSDGDESEGEDADPETGRFAALGPRLRTVALAAVGLAVLAAVLVLAVRRYGDRIASALPDRFRRGGGNDRSDGPVGSPEAERGVTGPTAGSGDRDGDGNGNGDGDETEDGGGAAVSPDGDLGALVALAFLALVAALARKVAETPAEDPFS